MIISLTPVYILLLLQNEAPHNSPAYSGQHNVAEDENRNPDNSQPQIIRWGPREYVLRYFCLHKSTPMVCFPKVPKVTLLTSVYLSWLVETNGMHWKRSTQSSIILIRILFDHENKTSFTQDSTCTVARREAENLVVCQWGVRKALPRSHQNWIAPLGKPGPRSQRYQFGNVYSTTENRLFFLMRRLETFWTNIMVAVPSPTAISILRAFLEE